MKLDAEQLRYLTRGEWRVLESVELGSKNHELVSIELVGRIARLGSGSGGDVRALLGELLKNKLIFHKNEKYDGYGLTYLGYDFLALRALASCGGISGVGERVGVGKEADVHVSESCSFVSEEEDNGNLGRALPGVPIILKLHRLGRTSFRTVKKNRDYLGKRKHASWMYMARLAAAKEFAFMRSLYDHRFPVPRPLHLNRHAIVMEFISGRPLSQVKWLKDPQRILEQLMTLIVRLARHGFIHCDFNEFNLMIDDDEKITLIDFPQMINTTHPQARMYFERDVRSVKRFFESRFGMEVVEWPLFDDVLIPHNSLTLPPGGNVEDVTAIISFGKIFGQSGVL